jgi:hypothetical protein
VEERFGVWELDWARIPLLAMSVEEMDYIQLAD